MFMRKGLSLNRLIGDFLILISLILLVWIYLPIVQLYLLPPIIDSRQSSYYILIPKINARSPIVENVDPWNKDEYQSALKKGVASAKGMNNFLFAHSSLPPWEMTRTNTPFLRLGELKNGDQIIIHHDGRDNIYNVVDKKEVWPNEVENLIASQDDQIILQTCTPVGTDLKRLLVFARRIILPQNKMILHTFTD